MTSVIRLIISRPILTQLLACLGSGVHSLYLVFTFYVGFYILQFLINFLLIPKNLWMANVYFIFKNKKRWQKCKKILNRFWSIVNLTLINKILSTAKKEKKMQNKRRHSNWMVPPRAWLGNPSYTVVAVTQDLDSQTLVLLKGRQHLSALKGLSHEN